MGDLQSPDSTEDDGFFSARTTPGPVTRLVLRSASACSNSSSASALGPGFESPVLMRSSRLQQTSHGAILACSFSPAFRAPGLADSSTYALSPSRSYIVVVQAASWAPWPRKVIVESLPRTCCRQGYNDRAVLSRGVTRYRRTVSPLCEHAAPAIRRRAGECVEISIVPF